ncbi:MAG TPA: UDP-N-acetylglucosamine 1-carboxyvinyltransferase [Candidatus Egerieenecus merdigallinarum]|nr:UDP-N-acetylglucosamine 1-carboxyvinyltransferase [Candidatus Egerieenecus merdigallinarum]
MEAFVVEGGVALRGEARVDSAKNAVLPILAAAVLTPEEIVLHNVPDITDVGHMAAILTMLGCRVERSGRDMTVDCGGIHSWEMPDQLSKQIRSSIFLLGPILARFRKATVTFPGGCEIGLRPIDLHLSGLRQLGVEISEEGGLIHCDGRNMHAGEVHFDYPSVGATENVMMAAVLLPGTTVIHNPAREPEIADLQAFINAMGGKIRGAGTHYIAVEGVERLHGTAWTPMADRIVAGTLLAAAAITGGEITLTNAPESDMVAVTAKLREMGCRLEERPGWIHLRAPKRLTAFAQLQTQPHPGFPTDMQVQMLALLSTAEGMGVITENVFENRFTHAGDLNRMGAHILCTGRTAVVRGVPELYGAHVTARDLRGGAALVLAGLRARGETLVDHAELIDRGYDHLERQLSRLGGKVRRVSAVPGEA